MNDNKNELTAVEKQEIRSAKKRELVKTLLIIFLIAMLILTFFSNTIMNRALAEVSTEKVTAGKLTEKIRGSGMVEANQSYEVKAEGARKVEKVHVRAGQTVNAGDVLFTLGAAGGQELSAAEDELSRMELEYQKALLTSPADYSSENQEIKNAQEDLAEAIRKRNAAYAEKASADKAKEKYLSDKAKRDSLSSVCQKLKASIGAIDSDDYSAAAPELIGDLPALLSNYTSAESEYRTAYEIYSAAVSEGTDAETALADSSAKEAARDSAKTDYDSEKSRIRASLAEQLSEKEPGLGTLEAAVKAYEESAPSGGISCEECDRDVQNKQRTLENHRISLAKTQNSNNVSEQRAALDLKAQKDALDKQKAKVESMKSAGGSVELKAEFGGIINSVNVTPGDITSDGAAVALITLTEGGFVAKISVDSDKAKKVSAGTKATVVNDWNGDTTAVLSDIKADTTPGSQKAILVFNITGSLSAGSGIELSIPLGSGNYDTIVPKSAVFQDQDGYFVYKLRSKSTPLGNRYYASRESVTVIVSDDGSSAVSGLLNNSDHVITAFSKPIKNGDQVRMKQKE